MLYNNCVYNRHTHGCYIAMYNDTHTLYTILTNKETSVRIF